MKLEQQQRSEIPGQEYLDILENRIKKLEEQVIGPETKQDELYRGPPIADVLLQTQLMISSALSCREAILNILQNLGDVNTYLDPMYGETDLDTESKRQFLLELYPQLMKDLRLLAALEKIAPMTDSGNILKVTDLSKKLDGIVVRNLDIYEKARELTQSVQKCLQQYFDITRSIKMVFAQMDTAVTEVEIATQPVIVIDE